MKIQVCSDFHGQFPKISQEADLLIFAGDVATTPGKVHEIFTNVRGMNEQAPIVYVLGNHEYYDNLFPSSRNTYKHAAKKTEDVLFLENSETIVQDFSILGCTLWTDYDHQRCITQAIIGMNDFDLITAVEGNTFRKVTPEDFITAHFESRKWLEKKLKANKAQGIKTIVVTHHMPSFSLISSKFKGSSLNGAFASNCDDLITNYEPVLWVYGHTHSFKDINLGNTRCVCNAVGYHGETTHYKEKYLVEI